MKIVSFEGSIGSGKTSLTNYFSHELGTSKLLEDFSENPFLHKFYEGNVDFEAETCFLMIHYYQIRSAIKTLQDDLVFMDFSIEKDLVYARMNLQGEELAIFEATYKYVIGNIVLPDLVIYVDLSNRILKRRIFQRGREFEMNADLDYFDNYSEHNKRYFLNESKSKVVHLNVDDLVLDPDDSKLSQIREIIHQNIRA